MKRHSLGWAGAMPVVLLLAIAPILVAALAVSAELPANAHAKSYGSG